MNKQGWEVKKLGEVCEIISGSTPRTNIEDYWNGKYNWVTPAELNERIDIIYETERKITQKAIKDTGLRLLPKGTVLLSSRAPIGKVALAGSEMYCNQGFKNLVCSDEIHNRYLFRFLKGKTDYLNSLGRGATFKEISKTIVANIPVPVPPLSIQKQIVKELDTLSEIIEKKKKQLAELDTLAQSTFYEMFGDPILNCKKWRFEKLRNIAPVSASKESIEPNDNKCWILNLDKIESNTGNIIEYQYKNLEEIGGSTYKIDVGNVLYSKLRPYLNKVVCPPMNGYASTELVPLRPLPEKLNKVFLSAALRSKSFVNYISCKVTGAKMPRTDMKAFKEFPLIVPPLPLQTQFAERIKVIEQQKSLIDQSIAEVQQLFDSAMDKYFH